MNASLAPPSPVATTPHGGYDWPHFPGERIGRLQVGDMPEATGPLSLRPHGANPEATFSCLPASTEVTALEKKKAFLPDTAVASRAELTPPPRRGTFPGPAKA